MILKILLVTGCLLLAPLSLVLAGPLYEGLPEEISLSVLEGAHTVEFSQPARFLFSPLGLRILINDKPTSIHANLMEAFRERFYAHVPKGHAIRRIQTETGERWEYPVGTQLFHLLEFQTAIPQVYELRTARLLPEGRWALGVYSPEEFLGEATPRKLKLNRYTGTPAFEVAFQSAASGRDLRIQMNRVPLHNCLMCHYGASPSKATYRSSDDAGPCGFGPAHPDLLTEWAKRFEQKTGEKPFRE
ncbi:MAG: hypothetical protein AB7F66_10205 [Bacteriovoracia bacterium]